MSVKLNSVKVSTDREENGDWVDSVSFPGVRYLVRGIKSQQFETARDLAFQKLAKAYKTTPVPGALRAKTLGKLVAEHILLGWEGFDEPFDQVKAAEVLTDPEFRNLVDDILGAAARVAENSLEFIEGLEKN